MPAPTGAPGSVARQWKRRVKKWIMQGKSREEILYNMASSNWPYDQALQFIIKYARRLKIAAIVMICCGSVGFFALTAVDILVLMTGRGFFAFPLFSLLALIYGIIMLTKIKA